MKSSDCVIKHAGVYSTGLAMVVSCLSCLSVGSQDKAILTSILRRFKNNFYSLRISSNIFPSYWPPPLPRSIPISLPNQLCHFYFDPLSPIYVAQILFGVRPAVEHVQPTRDHTLKENWLSFPEAIKYQ